MKEIVKRMKESKAFIPLFAGTLWSLITGGILTAVIVLTAMLFIAYLLINSRPLSYPEHNGSLKNTFSPEHPAALPLNQSPSNPGRSSLPLNQSQLNSQARMPEETSSSSGKLSQPPQTQATAFSKYQNSQGRNPSLLTMETPLSGDSTSIRPGAFDGPGEKK